LLLGSLLVITALAALWMWRPNSRPTQQADTRATDHATAAGAKTVTPALGALKSATASTGIAPTAPATATLQPPQPEAAGAAAPLVPPDATAATQLPAAGPSTHAKPRISTKRAPDATALTQALRKRQGQLEACFKQHSLALEGQPTTQLEFELAIDGTPTRVQLSPRRLTETALGQCLLRVARNTPFPPQPRAVSFVIPLTASASRGG
jgi:hypothetical protein